MIGARISPATPNRDIEIIMNANIVNAETPTVCPVMRGSRNWRVVVTTSSNAVSQRARPLSPTIN
ncbi:MAG: hypothetical protein JWR03_1014, partial [Cohnella sp.]|nr:hypothetical protein [Cohnella sp.]